jgi:hypothetical protein
MSQLIKLKPDAPWPEAEQAPAEIKLISLQAPARLVMDWIERAAYLPKLAARYLRV